MQLGTESAVGATSATELVVVEDKDKQPLQKILQETSQLASGFTVDDSPPKVTTELEKEEESEINMEDSTGPTGAAILCLSHEDSESSKPHADPDPEGGNPKLEQIQEQSAPAMKKQEYDIINANEPKGEVQGRESKPEERPRQEREEPKANQPSASVGILKKSNYIVAEKEEASVLPNIERKGTHKKEEEEIEKKVHIWQLVNR